MKIKILFMLALLLGTVTGAWATDYVTDVMLIGSGTSATKVKQQYVDQGWKDTDYNLNKGCGSSATNIYLLYKTSTNKADAITGFYIQCGSATRSDTQVSGGHTYLPVQGVYDDNFIKGGCNLNNNAGGNKIYLFYTKEAFYNRDAVTSIWFDNAKSGAVGSNGDENSGCDLNAGAHGSFIYMHVTYGEEPNTYDYVECSWDASQKQMMKTTRTCTSFELLTSNANSNHTILSDGWYVVNSDIEYKQYLDIDGDVKIILVDGKTMNAKNGIRIKTDKKLTIYGQARNSGMIKADGSIGGKGDIYAGDLIIHGGTIDCKSASHNNAAIGAGNGDKSSKANFKSITIYDGNVTATGIGGGAGIGSGQECNPHGPITIYGGTINAVGGDGAAGIGGGEESSNGPIYIYGGNVTAEGGGYGAGIGCGEDSHLTNHIYIYGGTVNATGGKSGGNGIGVGTYTLGYDLEHLFPEDQNYDVYIQDATVTARGKSQEACNSGCSFVVRYLNVKNSTVYLCSDAAIFDGEAILGDNLCVTVDDKGLVEEAERARILRYTADYAVIKPCNHEGATYIDNGDGTHTVNCTYCKGGVKPHNFINKDGICICIECRSVKSFVAQALWCEGNNTLYFVNTQEEFQKGEKYDGQTITSVMSGDNVTNLGNKEPTWGLINKANIMRVVFDESFDLARPTSLYRWFADCRELTIEGIEHLNTSECTTMRGLFSNCRSLTSLDVSGFDMSKVSNTESMFRNCENLKTIFCDNTWSGIANSEDMFNGCKSLRGSMGTVGYSADNADDITYANPSTGYFTNTGAVFAQALWCDGNKTLYFVHPEAPLKAGETFNGQTVTSVWSGGHVLSTGDTAPGWSAIKAEATNVVFDASFAEAKPTSLYSWFSDFTSLTTADLNGLDISEADNAASMFNGCRNLKTIFCDNSWTIANTEGMFAGCTSLVGAVRSDSLYNNGVMANPTTGYFTKMWKVELLNDGIVVSNTKPYTNEMVTISGGGDSGNGFVAIVVTGQRTDSVYVVTAGGDGTWSFTMPAENVTVREEINIAIYDGQDNSEVLKQYKGKTVNVAYDRTLSAKQNADGTWTSKAFTTCLPYRKDLQDEFWDGQVRLYELVLVNDDHEFVFNGVLPAVIEAGKPYLVVVDSASINLSANNVVTQAIPDQDEDEGVVYPNFESWQSQENVCGWWRGSYRLIDNEECTQLKAFLLNSDGKWRGTNNDTQAHRKAYLPTFRAYYQPKEFTDYWNYDTKFTVLEAGGDPSEIWLSLPEGYEGDVDYEGTMDIQPTIHTIDADGTDTYYDLQGRRISNGQKPTAKGIYINNGNKIINH